MADLNQIACINCRHQIDELARICPYCGADPRTGERIDPKPVLDEHFSRRTPATGAGRAGELIRRNRVLVAVLVAMALALTVFALNDLTTERLSSRGGEAAIPLAEVADLSWRPEVEELPIPDIEFLHSGDAKRLRTLIVEPGAVKPASDPELSEPERTAPASGARPAQPAQQTSARPRPPSGPAATKPAAPVRAQNRQQPPLSPTPAPGIQPPSRPVQTSTAIPADPVPPPSTETAPPDRN